MSQFNRQFFDALCELELRDRMPRDCDGLNCDLLLRSLYENLNLTEPLHNLIIDRTLRERVLMGEP